MALVHKSFISTLDFSNRVVISALVYLQSMMLQVVFRSMEGRWELISGCLSLAMNFGMKTPLGGYLGSGSDTYLFFSYTLAFMVASSCWASIILFNYFLEEFFSAARPLEELALDFVATISTAPDCKTLDEPAS